jgi:hypothetical protein
MKNIALGVLLLLFGWANAQADNYDDAHAVMAFAKCSQTCVEQMNECQVKLKPKCDNSEHNDHCYDSCNDEYSQCLGKCPKPVLTNPQSPATK